MDKLVIFNIGKGNFKQGFPVTLHISEGTKLPYTDMKDSLPPAPEFLNFISSGKTSTMAWNRCEESSKFTLPKLLTSQVRKTVRKLPKP